ncbi:Cell division control protein 2-like protein [Lachnellula suecica]|uniref:Cell division control protein 2-like protein n=1 Tax=Lachnellula suecica TaxID=602035 RepID=A0A8T9C4L3_9HELO|nr:Cell division control protein 2-like protein [Lachnellula suecica]
MRVSRARYIPCSRVSSALVGISGREYQRGKVLHSNQHDKAFDVHLAHFENKQYVLKRLPESFFELSQEHKRDFPDSRRIRLDVDYNEKEQTVVYEYFKTDLLALVQNNADFPLAARKQILFEIGKALQELHGKNWIHIDVKPNNVMVDWNLDDQGQVQIERVALIDLEVSLKLEGDKLLRIPLPNMQRLGNFMWRSPEAQTGQGIGKPADVFSFGLVCIYTLTSKEIMAVDHEELREKEVEPEIEILGRCIVYFGPLSEGLLKHTADETWQLVLRQVEEGVAEASTIFRLENWTESDYPNIDAEAKRMLGRIMNLDPAKRATMDEILEDSYWSQ